MVILVFFLVISVNRRLFRYFGSYSGISVIPVILVNRRTVSVLILRLLWYMVYNTLKIMHNILKKRNILTLFLEVKKILAVFLQFFSNWLRLITLCENIKLFWSSVPDWGTGLLCLQQVRGACYLDLISLTGAIYFFSLFVSLLETI